MSERSEDSKSQEVVPADKIQKAFDSALGDTGFDYPYNDELGRLRTMFYSNGDLILPLAEAASKSKTLEQRIEAVETFTKEKGITIKKFRLEDGEDGVDSKNKGYLRRDDDSLILHLSEELFSEERGSELVREVMHEWAGYKIIDYYGGRERVPILLMGSDRNRELFPTNRLALTHLVDVIFSRLARQFD